MIFRSSHTLEHKQDKYKRAKKEKRDVGDKNGDIQDADDKEGKKAGGIDAGDKGKAGGIDAGDKGTQPVVEDLAVTLPWVMRIPRENLPKNAFGVTLLGVNDPEI